MNDDPVDQGTDDDDTIDDASALLERVRLQVPSAADDADIAHVEAANASTGSRLRHRSTRRRRLLVASVPTALALAALAILAAVLASGGEGQVAVTGTATATPQRTTETLRASDDSTGAVPIAILPQGDGEPTGAANPTPRTPTSASSTSAAVSPPVTPSSVPTTEALPTQSNTTTESTETTDLQEKPSALPDETDVVLVEEYIGARKIVVASWSLDDTSVEITGWQVELDDKVLEFSPDVNDLEWEPLASGPVTARVRGVSDAGYGPWGTASIDVVLPHVVTSAGDPGPTEVFDEDDSPCDGANRTCRWIQASVSGFSEGRYLGLCFHDGFRWADGEEIVPQQFGDFWIDVDQEGNSEIHSPCYMTFSHVLGRGVQMAVELNGELVFSDWFTL